MKLLRISLLIFLVLFTFSLKSQWVYEGRLDNDGLFKYISVVDSGTVWTIGETWTGDSSIIYRRSPGGVWKNLRIDQREAKSGKVTAFALFVVLYY